VKSTKPQVCEIDSDGELLTLSDGTERWHTRMSVDGRTVSFLLDCGATVNLIPAELVADMG